MPFKHEHKPFWPQRQEHTPRPSKHITKTPFEELIATAYAEAALSQIEEEATQIMAGDHRDHGRHTSTVIKEAVSDWLDYLGQARTAYLEAKKQRAEQESEG